MLNLQIDPHSGVPVYRQIMDQVKYCGASGLLKPNSQLPSIRELALALSVNPTTIVKAYNELQHEGVIEMRHGKGAFLADAPRMRDAQRKQALRRLARQIAVEAVQMDAPTELVVQVVTEEIEAMRATVHDGKEQPK
jgi:GntR family transcriptional regulator